MNANDLNTALYEKMAAEQDTFRDWLKGQPPEEILNHAYEYAVREDIVMSMEELPLSEEQAAALLESPAPLGEVYRYFEKLETAYMDTVRDSIETRAGELAEQRAALMEKAKGLIADFCMAEYGSVADFDDLAEIGVAYTTVTDEEIPIQANVDLLNLRMERYLDGQLLDRTQYDSLEELIESELENLDFDSLTYVSEEALEAAGLSQEEPELTEKDMPVYLHSAVYASEHGEMAQYHASYQVNLACKEAIEEAVNAHYGNNRLDTDAAVKTVVERFGPERVQYILANTVQQKDWDGRISRDNKAWAKTVPMPEDSATSRHSAYLVVDKVNPGLTDLFTRKFRKVLQEPEKGSVLEKLKQEPQAHKPVVSKKREQER